jgi:hypothetical protein
MRRALSLTVLATALITALAGVVSASARTGSTSITIRARAQLLHASSVDNAPAGRSAGDSLVFTERLLNAAGRPIGSDQAYCVFLFDQRSLCTGAYLLRGGELMVQLVQPGLSQTRNYDQAIIGGTGRYARATGTVTVHQRQSGDRFVMRIRLPAG